jgi:hypothetical protein
VTSAEACPSRNTIGCSRKHPVLSADSHNPQQAACQHPLTSTESQPPLTPPASPPRAYRPHLAVVLRQLRLSFYQRLGSCQDGPLQHSTLRAQLRRPLRRRPSGTWLRGQAGRALVEVAHTAPIHARAHECCSKPDLLHAGACRSGRQCNQRLLQQQQEGGCQRIISHVGCFL